MIPSCMLLARCGCRGDAESESGRLMRADTPRAWKACREVEQKSQGSRIAGCSEVLICDKTITLRFYWDIATMSAQEMQPVWVFAPNMS
jgi:hypothetical protein